MKLHFHYCPAGFSNCYIMGTGSPENAAPDAPRQNDAVIIDPGIMDTEILSLIEDNNYNLRGIFITHDHPHHVRGVKTITRIYDTEIYAINPVIMERRAVLVKDGDIVNIGPLRVEVIAIPGHSADSAVFRIDRLLFTGDALSAGEVGGTASSYAAMNQVRALRSKIVSLPGDFTILPGHGPPSSLEAERRFNSGLKFFELPKRKRPVFRYER